MEIQPKTLNRPTYVLVEEEAAVRKKWLTISNEKQIGLFTYPSADWFLRDLESDLFNGSERFYLDQDFGRQRGVGVELARIIKKKWPNAFASLVTAYPKALFKQEIAEGVLDDVLGKYPEPFECAELTKLEQFYEAKVWAPIMKLVNDGVFAVGPELVNEGGSQ
jgi:hypothetical protein